MTKSVLSVVLEDFEACVRWALLWGQAYRTLRRAYGVEWARANRATFTQMVAAVAELVKLEEV